MNVGNIVITMGFVLIILFGSLSFYTALNVETENTDYLDLSGLEDYDDYNDLYSGSHDTISDPDSDFQTSSFGELIFGAGYSMLKDIFGGNWLVLTTNILVTSMGFAPIDPVILGLLMSIIGLTVLLVVVGAIMNRVLVGRDR